MFIRKVLNKHIFNLSERAFMDGKTTAEVLRRLKSIYNGVRPALKFSSDFELLVAVILSAQCTDERVNLVTKELFKEYNTPGKMLTLSKSELINYIRPCGLFNVKADNILKTCDALVERFGGVVPKSFDDLLSLNGVGRKTADVMTAVAFNGDAIAVDTHVFRVSRRIGLAKGDTPLKVERELMIAINKNEWSDSHHYILWHGRRVCKAKNPNCVGCFLRDICEKNGVKND